MGKTTTWMVNMKKLVGQGELGGLMVRLMMALKEQITRSRSFSAVATCQDHLRQASLDLVRSVFSPEKGIRLVGVTVSNFEQRYAENELPLFGAHTSLFS